MDVTVFNSSVDDAITNKTLPSTILPVDVGGKIKELALITSAAVTPLESSVALLNNLSTVAKYITVDTSVLSNGYIDTGGAFVASANWRSTDYIQVRPGDTIKYTGKTSVSANGATYYNSSKVRISSPIGNSIDMSPVNLVVPSGVSYVRLCATVASGGTYSFEVKRVVVDSLALYNLSSSAELNALINAQSSAAAATQLKRIADDAYVTQPVGSVNGYIDTGGAFVASANWRSTDLIPVSPGDKVRYSGKTSLSANAVSIYNSSSVFISALLGNSSDNTSHEYIIPDGTYYVRLCATVASGGTYSFEVGKYLVRMTNIAGFNVISDVDKLIKNILETWNAVGHSIWWQDGKVYATGPNAGSIAKGIQTRVLAQVKLLGYNNYGYSGRSLTGDSDTDVLSILEQKTTWQPAKIWTYDSITNDFKLNRPIGTTDDFINNTGITTYYGALRLLHERMKQLNSNYICICASPLQRNNSSYTSWSANTIGKTLKDYTDALLWVRNRLSWRYVDQFSDSGINLDNLTDNTIDGLHPFDNGYAKYSKLWVDAFFKL